MKLTIIQVTFCTYESRNVKGEWCIGSIHDSDPRRLGFDSHPDPDSVIGSLGKNLLNDQQP